MSLLPSPGTSPIDAARQYIARGWAVLPIPFGSKNPGFGGWHSLRLTEAELPGHFSREPRNIGVLLGEPSGNLVDVDLDHPLAVELADKFLPPTRTVFGRAGKPRSHRIYVCAGPIETKRFRSDHDGTIGEIRSTGAQTVFPPSTHPSGEVIEWEATDVEPAIVSPAGLTADVERLVQEVKTALPVNPATTAAHCLKAMMRIRTMDANDGSRRLFAAACRCVEHGLDEAASIACIRKYESERPFQRAWTDEDIRDRLRDAKKKCSRRAAHPSLGLPRIVLGVDEHRVADEAIVALSADRQLYERGGVLVRAMQVVEPGFKRAPRWVVQPVSSANLRERLTRRAAFIGMSKEGEELPAHPPAWPVAAIEARGQWAGVRSLRAILDAPVLLPDGSVLQEPGYHEASALLYTPSREFPRIDERAGQEQSRRAVAELMEAVEDFPFASPAHRSAWLSALLTPMARFAFDGPAPLFLFDSNVRGSGKTLLAQVISEVVLGAPLAVSSYSSDPEEMRKQITTLVIADERLVLMDNLEGRLGNGALDRALTSAHWRDRILGTNSQIDLAMQTTWIATGNNVVVGADTARRVVHVRVESLIERPEERRGFRHPNLLAWVAKNRPRLHSAALTILASYRRSGMHGADDLPPFGSFEGWSTLVRGAVVWAGLPDPIETKPTLIENSDSALEALGQLHDAVAQFDPHDEGFVVAEVMRRLYPPGGESTDDSASAALRQAFESIVDAPPGKPVTARAVGTRLRGFRRRVVRGRFLDCDPSEKRATGALWRLHRVEEVE